MNLMKNTLKGRELMKRKLIAMYCLIVIVTVITSFIGINNKAYAADNKPKDISKDKNGIVNIELFDPDDKIYNIAITPKNGYAIDTVKLYYTNKDDSYYQVNPLMFESGMNGIKIWEYKYQENYDRQEIAVTFRKTGNEGTLNLTVIEDTVSYGDNIKIKLHLKDKFGKSIRVTQNGELYLYAPLNKVYYSGIFSKSSNTISKDNIVIIDSSSLNGTTDLIFSGYYEDHKSGFVTSISDVRVKVKEKINSVIPQLHIEDSIQYEGHVSPLTVTSTPYVNNISVLYKVLRNDVYEWIHDVPQWPGTYEVEASISDNNSKKISTATATLTVKDDEAATSYKTQSFISSYNAENYVKANIENNNLVIEGKWDDKDISGYTLYYGNKYKKIKLTKNREFETKISLSDYSIGAYNIKISTNKSGQNLIILDLLIIKEKDEMYILESQALEINKKAINNVDMKKVDNDTINIDEIKYSSIVSKAKEITKTATTEYEKIKLIYIWIAENISYNNDQFYYGKNKTDQDAVNVFNNKIAVCAGYSNLMHVMLKSVGIKDIIISAYARVESDYRFGVDNNAGHAWNMAYSSEKERWVLLDSTWGSLNRYENKEFNYSKCNMYWFDCSIEAISIAHVFELIQEENANNSPISKKSEEYTIGVGDTISLFDYEGERTKITMDLQPANILQTINGYDVRAISAGICYVAVEIKTRKGDTYTKHAIVKVLDSSYTSTLTNLNNIQIDKMNRDSFTDANLSKTYSFMTNSDTEAYVFRFDNLSSEGDIYSAIYDSNGVELQYGICKGKSSIEYPVNLERNTCYYISIFKDDENSANYQFKIDSQKKYINKVYGWNTKIMLTAGETTLLELPSIIDVESIKSIKWKAYGCGSIDTKGVLTNTEPGSVFVECTIVTKDKSVITIYYDIIITEF